MAQLRATFQKLLVTKYSQNFREAVEKVTCPMLKPGPGEILIRNRYVGVNASDINHSAGRYFPGAPLPQECGFEGVGEVVATGPDCKMKVGQKVGYMNFGAYSEYKLMPYKMCLPLPQMRPEYIPLVVSALTAAISLDKVGEIKKGETVLVTAAAGGTGQFAVQLAKQAGCHVIGTCSSQEKVDFLKSIGCDRAINYREEKLHTVLKNEYPNGVDVVYESVGGEMFDTCVNRLAEHGRLIIIGFISGYETDQGLANNSAIGLPAKLLSKSASIRGFFLNNYTNYLAEYMMKLVQMYEEGKIKSVVDQGIQHPTGPFLGVDSIVDAVEYLYTKKNLGKIIVELPWENSSKL